MNLKEIEAKIIELDLGEYIPGQYLMYNYLLENKENKWCIKFFNTEPPGNLISELSFNNEEEACNAFYDIIIKQYNKNKEGAKRRPLNKELFIEFNFSPDLYSLYGQMIRDRVIMEYDMGKWRVFYFNKDGVRTNEKIYDTESEALFRVQNLVFRLARKRYCEKNYPEYFPPKDHL